MQPYLNTKREQIKKKRKIEYNLNSLKRDHRNIPFLQKIFIIWPNNV